MARNRVNTASPINDDLNMEETDSPVYNSPINCVINNDRNMDQSDSLVETTPINNAQNMGQNRVNTDSPIPPVGQSSQI